LIDFIVDMLTDVDICSPALLEAIFSSVVFSLAGKTLQILESHGQMRATRFTTAP
jgi:hypothetical protein